MIKRYPFESLGAANFGWLDTKHHFSFGRYVDRNRIQFGALRVINDDRIAPGRGFDMHPHDNMEIITYVRRGAITHTDSLGNQGRTEAGDVQVMSAGSGIWHSEFNREPVETVLFQIWILPNQENVTPRWDSAQFPKDTRDKLTLLVSGRDQDRTSGAMWIYQEAAVYAGRISEGTTLTHPLGSQAYGVVSSGHVRLNDVDLFEGDGVELTDLESIQITAVTPCELLIIEVPN